MSTKNITNSKSVLAKLLAQENISIEHKNVPTAYFDPKNRVLGLPIWKDMSSDLYDLLVGHEVGHAWETPPQGWHTAIEKNGMGFKSFLNVVEDARIEKLIKARYPGLRAPMYRGYKELFDSDFFGVKHVSVSSLNLIDRLNLHFKIGHMLNVPFNETDEPFLRRMENLKSWDDVYSLAFDLYEHAKDSPTTDIDYDYEDEYEYEFTDDPQDDNDLDDNDQEYQDKLNGGRAGSKKDPFSITDRNFRKREKDLLSDKVHPYVYANMPAIDYKKFIISHKEIYNEILWAEFNDYETLLRSYYNQETQATENFKKELTVFDTAVLYKEYRDKNEKFIQYLVKEFELRRNAKQFARASVSKTGELDTEKVWSFKLKDDLFKRVTKIPNGKNHGMVMFIDWSGSMTDNIADTLEQTIILADFCRKVQIKFEVYAFSDANGFNTEFRQNRYQQRPTPKDLVISNTHFKLLNLLSSGMSSLEYKNAIFKLLRFAKIYDYEEEQRWFRSARQKVMPKGLYLSGTPLNEAIIIANNLLPAYRKENKLDVVSTIFLTDGEGDDRTAVFDDTGRMKGMQSIANSQKFNVIIKDKDTGISVSGAPLQTITVPLLKMLKAKAGINLIGYYIVNSHLKGHLSQIINGYAITNEEANIEKAVSLLKKNKFYCFTQAGYDKYFVIQNKDLEIKEFTLDKVSNNKKDLTRAFIKNQKNKLVNRVLLNQFVTLIA